jgi:hypothetical protein
MILNARLIGNVDSIYRGWLESRGNGNVDGGVKAMSGHRENHGDGLIEKLRATLAEIQRLRAEEMRKGHGIWGVANSV